jgi:hypothetical protein
MKLLVFCSIAIFSMATAFASEEKIYRSWNGDINMTILGEQISERIGEDVQVTAMRSVYNPFDMYDYIFGDKYINYFVFLTINKVHKVKCDFVLIRNDNRIMIHRCESKTAEVDIPGFFSSESLGMTPFLNQKEVFN